MSAMLYVCSNTHSIYVDWKDIARISARRAAPVPSVAGVPQSVADATPTSGFAPSPFEGSPGNVPCTMQ